MMKSIPFNLTNNTRESRTLHDVIERRDINEVKRLINVDKLDVDERKPAFYGYTPLMKAVQLRELEIVKFLLEKKANIFYETTLEGKTSHALAKTFEERGKSALSLALDNGCRDIEQILFTEIILSFANNPIKLKKIIDRNNLKEAYRFDLNFRSIKIGENILIFASRKGYLDTVKLLIENYNIDPLVTLDGKKAWEFAINDRHWDIARILFETHANKYLHQYEDANGYLRELQTLSDRLLQSFDPSSRVELSIIQVIDCATTTAGLGSAAASMTIAPSKILLQLSTQMYSDFVFKLVYIEEMQKWYIAYSKIQDRDLYVLNDYYRKIIEISIDNYQQFFSNMIRAMDTSGSVEPILSYIASITSLELSDYEKVQYTALVGRGYTDNERSLLAQKMLEEQVAALGDSHITFAVTLEEYGDRLDEHETKIDSISTELDNVHIEVNDIRTVLDKLETDLNGLMVIIGIAAAPYKDPSYERTLYLTLRWYLNSAYTAALVVSSPEGMVSNSRAGTTGSIGNVLEAISSHVPMGGGIVVQFFGAILKSIDAKHQANMVMHCAKLAPGSMGMEALSHNIATRILNIISTLDIDKMESTTNSMAEKCINMIIEAISWMSDNSAQIETAIHNPMRAVEEGAAALAACELRRQAVEYFTQEIEKLSKDKQFAQKHACIIATLLISRIYIGEKLEEYEVISNANTLVEYITSEYMVVSISSIQPIQTTTSNLVGASQEKRSGCVSYCIVSYVTDIVYDNTNPFLRSTELLHEAQKIGGIEAINDLIELGEDLQIAYSIITEVKQYGAQHVLNILLRNNNRIDAASIKIKKTITEEIILLDDEASELYSNLEHNKFLNHNKGIEFIEVVKKLLGEEAALLLLELGQDESIAKQILHEVEEQGIEKVLSTLFNKEITTSIQEINDADNNVVSMIAIIENVLGEQESQELTGLSQYIMNALSNNRMSDSARQVIKIMSKLVQNLEDLLEINSMHGEDVSSYDNYVTVIWAQLAGLFEFIESGQRFINFVPRPPYFDPDSDSGGYGGSDGGSGRTSNGQNFDNDINAYLPMFLIGYNLTITSDS